VHDLQSLAGTVSELLERPNLVADVRAAMTTAKWTARKVFCAPLKRA
jgi:hypothetical protein